jgi:glycosyltransferase involved in cell wall biosynthesis
MTHAVKYSVLINNRDNARYLRRCVESVLEQTLPADEIIIFDDGSRDDSLDVLATFGQRVRVLSGPGGTGTPMQNQAHAIEAAFRESSGAYIFLLDSDDAFTPDHIASYVKAFARSKNVIMVQAPLWKINEAGSTTGLEYDRRRHATNYLEHIYSNHEVNIYYPTSSLAFRREYLDRRLPFDDRDDLGLWPDAQLALIAPHFGEIVTLDEPHTFWRRHALSHTVIKKTSVYEQVRLNRAYYNQFCATKGLPLVRSWRSRQQMKRWLRHICPPFLLESFHHLGRRRLPSRGSDSPV